jgi:hypothetical protein
MYNTLEAVEMPHLCFRLALSVRIVGVGVIVSLTDVVVGVRFGYRLAREPEVSTGHYNRGLTGHVQPRIFQVRVGLYRAMLVY